MKMTILGNIRKDGKYKVRLFYPGALNMFGGREHGKSFISILTPAKVRELLANPALGEIRFCGSTAEDFQTDAHLPDHPLTGL